MTLEYFLRQSPEEAVVNLKYSYEFKQKDLQKILEDHFVKMFKFAKDNKEAFLANHDSETENIDVKPKK